MLAKHNGSRVQLTMIALMDRLFLQVRLCFFCAAEA